MEVRLVTTSLRHDDMYINYNNSNNIYKRFISMHCNLKPPVVLGFNARGRLALRILTAPCSIANFNNIGQCAAELLII